MTALLDALLGLLAAGLAAAALWSGDRLRMITLFIAAGSVTALIWVRLAAPDLALAEVAIGAGLTGGLLLRTHGLIAWLPGEGGRTGRWHRLFPLALSAILFAPLAWALAHLPWPHPRPAAAELVAANLSASGVSNPVTAVLLNFRSYDTLLEVAVLLAAVAGVWMLGARAPAVPRVAGDRLFHAMLRLVVPLLTGLAGYLLWLGSFAPGGAFQGGAMLAAALALLLLSDARAPPGRADDRPLRLALVAGLAVFIGVAVAMVARGGALLEYPAGQAKNWIVFIEGVLTVSIAVTLLMLFVGGRPAGDASDGDGRPR